MAVVIVLIAGLPGVEVNVHARRPM
jgi:hypothetical protein